MIQESWGNKYCYIIFWLVIIFLHRNQDTMELFFKIFDKGKIGKIYNWYNIYLLYYIAYTIGQVGGYKFSYFTKGHLFTKSDLFNRIRNIPELKYGSKCTTTNIKRGLRQKFLQGGQITKYQCPWIMRKY